MVGCNTAGFARGFTINTMALSIQALLFAQLNSAYAEVTISSQQPIQIIHPTPPGGTYGSTVTMVSNGNTTNIGISTGNGLVPANILPTNPQVSAGDVQFQQSGSHLDIHQNSQNAVINWGGFKIGENAEVNFIQPNALSIALNRVLSGTIEIDGKLTANGQVFLIDPNGVMFGKNAQVNVGALVATTLNISDSDFLNANYQFTAHPTLRGDVVNNGSITAADNGYVVLLSAKNTDNSGNIYAHLGRVELAAGEAAKLVLDQGKLINLQVDAATVNSLVSNHQLIQAEGGTVILTAGGITGLSSAVINNSGIIEAKSITDNNGVIQLVAEGDATATRIENSGTLNVSADAGQNQNGGSILEKAGTIIESGKLYADGDNGGQISIDAGKHFAVSSATISADGKNGDGGLIQIKSKGDIDHQVPGADAHSFTAIHANGNNGGKVDMQAGNKFWYQGGISASGGQGHGGTVTIASGDMLDYTGGIAAEGKYGNGGSISVNSLKSLTLTGGAWVDSIQADGGQINFKSANDIVLIDSTINTDGIKNAGTINLESVYGSSLLNSTLSAKGTGNGGEINIQSGDTVFSYKSYIYADGGVNGGNIHINSNQTQNIDETIIVANGGVTGGTINLTSNGGYLELFNNIISAHGGLNQGKIAIEADLVKYWTNNYVDASAGTGKPDVIQLNSNGHAYTMSMNGQIHYPDASAPINADIVNINAGVIVPVNRNLNSSGNSLKTAENAADSGIDNHKENEASTISIVGAGINEGL